VLAGIISTFAGIKTIHNTVSDLHFIAPTSIELLALQVGFVTFVLGLCFFSFTYALRKLIYTISLIGALPDSNDASQAHEEMVVAAPRFYPRPSRPSILRSGLITTRSRPSACSYRRSFPSRRRRWSRACCCTANSARRRRAPSRLMSRPRKLWKAKPPRPVAPSDSAQSLLVA